MNGEKGGFDSHSRMFLERAASVGGLCYPSSPAAFITRRWIDFAPRSHRLHNQKITGAIACRTFFLSRIRWRVFRRRLFQLRPFKKEDRQPEYNRPTAFRLGPGNVRCFQPTRSQRLRNESRSLILIPALRVKSGTGKRDQLAAPLIAPRPARHFTIHAEPAVWATARGPHDRLCVAPYFTGRILPELSLAEICADRIKPRDFEGSAPNQRRLAIIFRSGGVVHSAPDLRHEREVLPCPYEEVGCHLSKVQGWLPAH
jgi:hypothetical protein